MTHRTTAALLAFQLVSFVRQVNIG